MSDSPRKKSPRAPSISLDEAIERVLRVYEKERLHPAPTEVVAQNLGYKSANSGTALSAIASLRYFGLLEKPKDGFLAVSKEVEIYKFAPEEGHRRSVLLGFLKRPPLYADLLEKFARGLPSDANLKFKLIQRGFMPPAAAVALAAFKRSIEFVDYFRDAADLQTGAKPDEPSEESLLMLAESSAVPQSRASRPTMPAIENADDSMDRIPVRLPGGRRAWLVIPTPFFEDDKARLKAQIDLLLTENDEVDL